MTDEVMILNNKNTTYFTTVKKTRNKGDVFTNWFLVEL